jgi:hypothetical protein
VLHRCGTVRPLPFMLAGALLAAAVLGGCGGKSNSMSTADWANGFCSAITTWKTSVTSTVNSVKSGNLSKSSIQGAADQFETATATFVDSLKKLGKPKATSGTQAKQAVDQLEAELETEKQKIKTTIGGISSVSEIAAAAPTVVASLQSMGSDVSATFKQLQSLPSGEVKKAFNQASACKTLEKSA